eukprot:jgi/Botrbrau1/2519/Bobra.0079s0011.1
MRKGRFHSGIGILTPASSASFFVFKTWSGGSERGKSGEVDDLDSRVGRGPSALLGSVVTPIHKVQQPPAAIRSCRHLQTAPHTLITNVLFSVIFSSLQHQRRYKTVTKGAHHSYKTTASLHKKSASPRQELHY